MAKTKLTVVTPVGTFTRTTARTYTHLVAVSTYTDAYLARAEAEYDAFPWWQQRKAAAAEWHVLGWSGRLDLARKVATSYQAGLYVHVRIFDVATGQEVR